MKKIILAAILAMFASTTAFADRGINIGISGQMGLFAATATETDTGTHGTTTDANEKVQERDFLGIGYASLFIEKTLGDRLFIGYDYVPNALETETMESARSDITTTDTPTVQTNKVQVDFVDLSTLYLGLNIGENAYVRVGSMSVDVETNESLGTGAKYGNTSLDGTSIGVGYNAEFGNSAFIRLEGNYMEFDGASLTSGSQKITLDSLDGVTGKVSIGKSF